MLNTLLLADVIEAQTKHDEVVKALHEKHKEYLSTVNKKSKQKSIYITKS